MTSEGRGELGVQGDVVESPDELGGRSGGHLHLSRRGGAGGLCSTPGDTRRKPPEEWRGLLRSARGICQV